MRELLSSLQRQKRMSQKELEARKQTNAYHHFVKEDFLDLHAIWNLIHENGVLWGESANIPTTSNTNNLQWIKDHLKELKIDPLDMEAIEKQPNIFRAIGSFGNAMLPKINVVGDPTATKRAKDMNVTSMLTWWHIYNIWNHRGQIFQIQPGLADKLYLTDVHQVKWGDVHFPFPSLVLHIPPYLCSLEDAHTGWHEVDTVFVTNGRILSNNTRSISLFLIGRENKNSIIALDDSAFFVNLFREEDGIEASIQRAVGNMRNDVPISKNVMRDKEGRTVEKAAVQIIRFVISCLLYINMHPDDVQKDAYPQKRLKTKEKIKTLTGKKRKNATKRLKSIEATHSQKPFVVGRKVVIDKKLSQVAKAESKSYGHVQTASYVRGHMKKQAHGPSQSLRKLIWVEPHMRGFGKLVEKSYEVR